MNKGWSELNKRLQSCLRKEESYRQGIEELLELRGQLMQVLVALRDKLSRGDFNAMPFINSKGYHNKTIAYSIWHIFRIEDIVSHTLINDDEQVFFRDHYQSLVNSPIMTTGNELIKQEIADFSRLLDIDNLYSYAIDVKESSEIILKSLSFIDLKRKITSERRRNLISLNVVGSHQNSSWLIDYWCNKDIRGLIQMPLSRHWIMHAEAILRITHNLHPDLLIVKN